MPLVRTLLHCARREKRVSQLIGFERFRLARSIVLAECLWKLESRDTFVKFVSSICRSYSDVGTLSHICTAMYVLSLNWKVFRVHTRRIYSECANTLYDVRDYVNSEIFIKSMYFLGI